MDYSIGRLIIIEVDRRRKFLVNLCLRYQRRCVWISDFGWVDGGRRAHSRKSLDFSCFRGWHVCVSHFWKHSNHLLHRMCIGDQGRWTDRIDSLCDRILFLVKFILESTLRSRSKCCHRSCADYGGSNDDGGILQGGMVRYVPSLTGLPNCHFDAIDLQYYDWYVSNYLDGIVF